MKLMTGLEHLRVVLQENRIKDDIEILLPRDAMQRLLLEMSETERILDGTSSRNTKLFDQIVISHIEDKNDRIFRLADYAAHRMAMMLTKAMVELDAKQKDESYEVIYHEIRRELREGFLEHEKK